MARLNELPKKLLELLKKYKYAALVLLIGIALLLIPSGKEETQAETVSTQAQQSDEDYALQMEQKLSSMLTQIEGAGKVSVMLTLERSSRTEYQTDVQISSDSQNSQESEDRKTVILSEGSAYDKAAVSAVEYPRFQGALIVCQGADQAAVKLNLINAVSALTGLSSDQITVVKMK